MNLHSLKHFTFSSYDYRTEPSITLTGTCASLLTARRRATKTPSWRNVPRETKTSSGSSNSMRNEKNESRRESEVALQALTHPHSSLVLTVQFGAGAQPILTGLHVWQFVLYWWCAWQEPIAAELVKEMQPATAWWQAAFYDHPVLFLFKRAFHSNWNVQIKGGEKAAQPAPFTHASDRVISDCGRVENDWNERLIRSY